MSLVVSPDGRVLFTEAELRCKCNYIDCEGTKFAKGFLDDLLVFRLVLDMPMSPTSCCRCQRHNRDIGSSDGSFHNMSNVITKGTCGIDFAITSPKLLCKANFTAELLGWSIGINWKKNFIHIDKRVSFGQQREYFFYKN